MAINMTSESVYRRLGFGIRPFGVDIPTDMQKWVGHQLTFPSSVSRDNDAVSAELAAALIYSPYDTSRAVPLGNYAKKIGDLMPVMNDYLAQHAIAPPADGTRARLPGVEVDFVTLVRQARGSNPLLERMVEFWTNHFHVSTGPGPHVSAVLPQIYNAIGANALGNFRLLLEATLTSVPMLIYLNQAMSQKNNPNENYARELLELHTLGGMNYAGITGASTSSSYCDQDVKAAAKILCGCGYDKVTGSFKFDPNNIVSANVTFLGRAITSGKWESVGQMLDILCQSQLTARFISTKLYRHFVQDEVPPDSPAVAAMAQAFLANWKKSNQIACVLGALFSTDEFLSSSGSKFKTPVEFMASVLRILDRPLVSTSSHNFGLSLAAMGQDRYGWPTPEGPPMNAAPWLSPNSLANRWAATKLITINPQNLGATIPLLTGWSTPNGNGGIFRAVLFDDTGIVRDPARIRNRLYAAVFPDPTKTIYKGAITESATSISQTTRQALEGYSSDASLFRSLPRPDENEMSRKALQTVSELSTLLAVAVSSPEFQLRG